MAQRMKRGGHRNEGAHCEHYQANNPCPDLQDALFGGQLRTIAADHFRAITVSCNPNLFQTLPAGEHYFEMSPEFVALDRQLGDLKARPGSEERGTAVLQSARGET